MSRGSGCRRQRAGELEGVLWGTRWVACGFGFMWVIYVTRRLLTGLSDSPFLPSWFPLLNQTISISLQVGTVPFYADLTEI